MLERHVDNVPSIAYNILDLSVNPTTIIYNCPAGVAENLIADDRTLSIRVVKYTFCEKLIRYLGKPLVSTSANISGQPTPKSFEELSDVISIGVDYIANLQSKNTILKMITKRLKEISLSDFNS